MGSRQRRKITDQIQHDKWHKMDMNKHATVLWKISQGLSTMFKI